MLLYLNQFYSHRNSGCLTKKYKNPINDPKIYNRNCVYSFFKIEILTNENPIVPPIVKLESNSKSVNSIS